MFKGCWVFQPVAEQPIHANVIEPDQSERQQRGAMEQ